MKAYYVYSWDGEYEQYMEYGQKYFLNESSARKYEKDLEVECAKHESNSSFSTCGVSFEEIEIIED
jgi:hypothetical protein